MECTFPSRCGKSCGPVEKDSCGISKVPLTECIKDVSTHLRCFKIPGTVDCERDLILARAGIYEVPPDISRFTICKRHRDCLGLGWRRNSKYCQVPQSVATHKSNRMADRGIGPSQSKKIFELTSQIMPLGAGKHSCYHCSWCWNTWKNDIIRLKSKPNQGDTFMSSAICCKCQLPMIFLKYTYHEFPFFF